MNDKIPVSGLFALVRGQTESQPRTRRNSKYSHSAASGDPLAFRLANGHVSSDEFSSDLGMPTPSTESRRQRMLLVEDSDDDALFVEWAVSRSRYALEVDRASTGVEARKLLSEGIPALIVLDCRLPDTTGLELLKDIRRRKGFCRVPIVMMSDTACDEDVQRALCLGANSFVKKPLCYGSYMATVEAMLGYWLGLNYSGSRKIDVCARHAGGARHGEPAQEI